MTRSQDKSPPPTETSVCGGPDLPAPLPADLSVIDPADPVEDRSTVDPRDSVADRQRRVRRVAWTVCAIVLVALLATAGWLGHRELDARRAAARQARFLEVGRQGTVNLTTINWRTADTDVARILDSATGAFYDDFSKRSQAFVDVVKQAQSTSVGTIVDAGLESASADGAQVLVAVNVQTSNASGVQQEPRRWRMRMSVQQAGDAVKVSNVAFVP